MAEADQGLPAGTRGGPAWLGTGPAFGTGTPFGGAWLRNLPTEPLPLGKAFGGTGKPEPDEAGGAALAAATAALAAALAAATIVAALAAATIVAALAAATISAALALPARSPRLPARGVGILPGLRKMLQQAA